jgi:hypothetical protein
MCAWTWRSAAGWALAATQEVLALAALAGEQGLLPLPGLVQRFEVASMSAWLVWLGVTVRGRVGPR